MAVEGQVLAREELADDLDRLLQHAVPPAHGGPPLADDVLVEVLPRAEPQEEPVVGQHAEVAAACATTAGW